MRNKKLINRKIDITQGWQFCSPVALQKEGEKRKKGITTRGIPDLVTHPSTKVAEQGLTLLSGRNMLLSLWYSDSTLNAFFKVSKMRKGLEKNI